MTLTLGKIIGLAVSAFFVFSFIAVFGALVLLSDANTVTYILNGTENAELDLVVKRMNHKDDISDPFLVNLNSETAGYKLKPNQRLLCSKLTSETGEEYYFDPEDHFEPVEFDNHGRPSHYMLYSWKIGSVHNTESCERGFNKSLQIIES